MQKLLKKLITFQTDSEHLDEIEKCFKFVVNNLKEGGLKVKTYSRNKKPSLVAAAKLKKNYQFIFNGHLDVVPANYQKAFEPTIKGDRLYGRGTSDMKGTLATMLELSKGFLKGHPTLDFALMITSDEEVGGFDGVDYLLNQKGYSCDCAIIPDGGQNWHLVQAEKGILHVKVEAKGKAAHGSRPWLGTNALDKLVRVYSQIRKGMPKVSKDDRWKQTLNLGVLKGGDVTNKVCDSAFMQLDFRYPQSRQKEVLVRLIKRAVTEEKGVSWQILAEGAPLINHPKNKYFKAIQKAAKKSGRRLKIKKEDSGSDGRFFSAKKIPVIMFKPLCSGSHVNNEWVDLKNLQLFSQILRDFVLSCSTT